MTVGQFFTIFYYIFWERDINELVDTDKIIRLDFFVTVFIVCVCV